MLQRILVQCVLGVEKPTAQSISELQRILVTDGDTIQSILIANATHSITGAFNSIHLIAIFVRKKSMHCEYLIECRA